MQVKETATTVYHNIRTLMEESDANKFKIMLQKTMEQLNHSHITQKVLLNISIPIMYKEYSNGPHDTENPQISIPICTCML